MATLLAHRPICELGEGLDQIFAGEIARHRHAAITSSRAMCKRMIPGPVPSSKWQCTASLTWAYKVSRSSASVKMSAPTARAK